MLNLIKELQDRTIYILNAVACPEWAKECEWRWDDHENTPCCTLAPHQGGEVAVILTNEATRYRVYGGGITEPEFTELTSFTYRCNRALADYADVIAVHEGDVDHVFTALPGGQGGRLALSDHRNPLACLR